MSEKVAFFAPSHSTYVCAEITSDPPIVMANRAARGPWEEFEVEPGELPDSFAFRANNGKYLRCLEDDRVLADADRIQSWESFRPHYEEDGLIAWETAHHKFLRATDAGALFGDAKEISAWERFAVEGWEYGLAPAANPLQGRVHGDGRMLCDASGPRVYPSCHFFEAFSLFCRDEGAATQQLEAIAQTYPVVRILDVVGYFDYWRGREVSPIDFIAQGGYHVAATYQYWEKLLKFYSIIKKLGLKTHHTRGDLQLFGGRERIKEHVAQVCRVLRDNGFQESVEIMEVCNEYELNGVANASDARYIGEAIRENLPGTLLTNGAPFGTEEADAIREAAEGGDVANVHGMRPGYFVDVLRHIFSVRREGFDDAEQRIIQGEPFGPGDDVSGTRHEGDPLGRSDDVEFLCAAGLISSMTGQRWTYMSGYGVRWNGPIESQPGFAEVARAVCSVPNDIFSWETTRGGSSNNPFRSPSGYYGDAGVSAGPARIDGAVSGGQFELLVYGGKPPYTIEACQETDFQVINPATMEIESEGVLPAGGRVTLNYRIGRLVRSSHA